jgi:hypothetical protein
MLFTLFKPDAIELDFQLAKIDDSKIIYSSHYDQESEVQIRVVTVSE